MFKILRNKGMSNYNIHVKIGKLHFRFSKNNSPINRKNEQNVLKLLKKDKTITNKTYFFNKHIMISKYEEEYFNLLQNTWSNINLEKLIKLIFQLQKINVKKKEVKKFEFDELTKNIENKKLVKEVKEYYKEGLVLSHNDLGKNNILFNGCNFKIIDFEFARLNIKYFDYANLLLTFEVPKNNQEILLKYANIDKDELEKVRKCMELICLMWIQYSNEHKINQNKYKNLGQKYKKLLIKLQNNEI